jgi:hypothetical protein
MVKYIISCAKGLERTERQIKESLAAKEEKERRQASLRDAARNTEDLND